MEKKMQKKKVYVVVDSWVIGDESGELVFVYENEKDALYKAVCLQLEAQEIFRDNCPNEWEEDGKVRNYSIYKVSDYKNYHDNVTVYEREIN